MVLYFGRDMVKINFAEWYSSSAYHFGKITVRDRHKLMDLRSWVEQRGVESRKWKSKRYGLTVTVGVSGTLVTKLEKWKKLKLLYNKNLQDCIAIRQVSGARQSYILTCNPGVSGGKMSWSVENTPWSTWMSGATHLGLIPVFQMRKWR